MPDFQTTLHLVMLVGSDQIQRSIHHQIRQKVHPKEKIDQMQKVENVLIVQPHQHPFGEGTAMVTIYAMHVDSITK